MFSSPIDGQPGSFRGLAIVSDAVGNVGMPLFPPYCFCFPWNKYPELDLLNHAAVPFLIFRGTATPFPTLAAPFRIPAGSAWGAGGPPLSPHPHRHSLFPVLLITAILTGAR